MLRQKINRILSMNVEDYKTVTRVFLEFCEQELQDIPKVVKAPLRFDPSQHELLTGTINIRMPQRDPKKTDS